MNDSDYAALMLAVWLAPVMATEHRTVYYVMLALFFVLGILAHMKEYYKRKVQKLCDTTPGSR